LFLGAFVLLHFCISALQNLLCLPWTLEHLFLRERLHPTHSAAPRHACDILHSTPSFNALIKNVLRLIDTFIDLAAPLKLMPMFICQQLIFPGV